MTDSTIVPEKRLSLFNDSRIYRYAIRGSSLGLFLAIGKGSGVSGGRYGILCRGMMIKEKYADGKKNNCPVTPTTLGQTVNFFRHMNFEIMKLFSSRKTTITDDISKS
jgi:hypothetical protein